MIYHPEKLRYAFRSGCTYTRPLAPLSVFVQGEVKLIGGDDRLEKLCRVEYASADATLWASHKYKHVDFREVGQLGDIGFAHQESVSFPSGLGDSVPDSVNDVGVAGSTQGPDQNSNPVGIFGPLNQSISLHQLAGDTQTGRGEKMGLGTVKKQVWSAMQFLCLQSYNKQCPPFCTPQYQGSFF